MSGQLPWLEGLATPDKYERLLERVPDLWWGSASPFAGLHQLNVARVAYFRSVFGGFQGKRVLDVGSGGGILAESLAAEGADVTGIDPSEKSLAVAREHAAQSGLTIDYRLASAESLASSNFAGHFDLVFATGVLQQVADLDSAIAGISRVLAPGGGLGFVTHNRTIAAFLRLIWEEEYVHQTLPQGFHEFARFVTPEELAERLGRNDLVVQEMKGFPQLTDDLSVSYIGWALRTRLRRPDVGPRRSSPPERCGRPTCRRRARVAATRSSPQGRSWWKERPSSCTRSPSRPRRAP